MRLIAVPLARLRPCAPPVYTFLAQRTPPTILPPTLPSSSASSPSPSSESKPPPLSTRLLKKASDFWLALAEDGKDGKSVAVLDWKRRTYKTGEKLMDRIEYEEWALKAVDPSMGPALEPVKKSEGQKAETTKVGETPSHRAKIPIHFPANVVSPNQLLHTLRTLTASRTPHHRRSLIFCVVGMPFTIPFMLIPIVPNLPFFYLVWRAWSHWKAFKSSQYLSGLLSQNRISPTADSSLGSIFQTSNFDSIKNVTDSPSASENDSTPAPPAQSGEPVLLLSSSQIELLKKDLQLNQLSVHELERARQQTLTCVQKGNMGKIEKAAEDYGKDGSSASTGETAIQRGGGGSGDGDGLGGQHKDKIETEWSRR